MVDKQTLTDMYLQRHLTMAEIGKIYGVTRMRISQLVKQYGIDSTNAKSFPNICDKCGKEYRLNRKRYRKHSTHYCSIVCYLSSRKNEDYHPKRNGQREARRIMAKHIGRPLTTNEIVHYIDGNCSNNNLDNLVLFPSHAAHLKWHHSIRQNGMSNVA